MTGTELFFIALAFLLVGGFQHVAERLRALLDTLRPPPFPDIVKPGPNAFWDSPPPGEPERTREMPKPPPYPPPPGFFDPNPDHNEYDKDSQLGGVSSHVPEPPPSEGDEEEKPF